MPSEKPHRRYLIAIGITTDLPKSGQRIVDSVNLIARVFTNDFGYERVTSLDIDPGLDLIRKEIREFCLNCDPEDIVALYYTGHADEVNEKHRAWTGDTMDRISGTLETGHLAELMLVDTPLRYALIMLDTCFAGKGGAEALRASMPSMAEGDGKTLALITAAYPREQIVAGDFARLFERAVQQRAVAGHEPRYLAVGAIVGVIDSDPSRPGWQTISHSVLFEKTDVLPFFPNHRFNAQLHGLDLLTQLRIEQQELRVSDMRGHFLPRARGVDVPADPGWRFVGREAALRELVVWLRDSGNLSARVVTGGPGSGKSAVIGRLVVLSDRDWRRTVPMENLAPDIVPPEGSIAVGIHARGMTTAQVLTALGAVIGTGVDTAADLLREMRGRNLTVAIDAVDEALDPAGLVSSVLRPLVEAGPAEGLRLLLGTRPHLLEPLGVTTSAIDLDDERYADPDSLYEYVVRGLEADNPQSPYHSAPAELVKGVAAAVADAAGHSFLVALIVSRTLLSAREVPDPKDSVWRAGLPGTAAAAMHNDLETRLGSQADRARDLLRPLAFAHGAGLPWEDLWAPLAAKLSGRSYTDEDLIWLRRQAGSYVVETMESGHSVYRLYHAALAEYLRQGYDEAHIHELFSEFLTGRVPTSHTGLDWNRAHPYTLAHVATHAQRAGMLDGLLLDPGFLVNAIPAGLLAALPAARSSDAERAARAYQRAVHQLRNQPEDHRFSYLEFASRITHATALASLIAVSAPRRRWSVPWTHWPPEHPHRVMAGHLGQVDGVACADPGDGNWVVASIGRDSSLRIWDLMTAEPRGKYFVGTAPLVAIRSARLPEHRTIFVLLSADGMLHTWDMSTATILRTVPVVPRWRRLASMRGPSDLVLRCLATSDGQQFAVVGGPGLRTSVWNLSSGRQAALLPRRAAPEAVEFTELIDQRPALIVSLGGNERLVCDLQTGQKLPYEQPLLPPSSWLRSAYNRYIRGERETYYALRTGPPAIAIRSSRRTATVIDLATGRHLGIWDLGSPDVRVQLSDSQTVSVPIPELNVPGALGQDENLEPKVSRALGAHRLSESHQREVAADSVVPLGTIRRLDQADRESGEPFWMRCELRGRFLQVELRDNVDGSGRGPTSITLAGHAADVTGYDWVRMPDGGVVIVSSGRDGTIRRWDINEIGPGPSDEAGQASTALHRVVSVPLADSTRLGLTIADGTDVALWDLRTGKLVGKLHGRTAGACAIGLVPQPEGGPLVVTFDADRTARIWSLPDGNQEGGFPADRRHWPSDTALTRLPDGTRVAVTSGHGRKTIVWDLSNGRIRNVLSGHSGWSACVTCAEGRGRWPSALTGGLDNRINVWDLHFGRLRRRLRIVPWRIYLARPATGRAHAIRTTAPAGVRALVLVVTSDGMARALRLRTFPWGAQRTGAVPASSVETATLSNGRTVVVTATDDGMLRIWKAESFTGRRVDDAPLCEINIEVPINDINIIDVDTLIIATPNGLTALRLDAGALEADRRVDPSL